MSHCWANATHKQYENYIKQWETYCNRRNLCSAKSNINIILEFLTVLFKQGSSYSKINTMKYSHTWDVNILLNFIKNNLANNCSLSLHNLTLKAVTLTALCSGQRAQTIHEMDLNYFSKIENRLTFTFINQLKTSKPGKTNAPIEIFKFEDADLCVFTCIESYISRTEKLRSCSKLWRGVVKPHKAVSKETVSRWIKSMLNMAGIDTDKFSAHSTRMASTSKANCQGGGMDTILRTASWESETNFLKFYCRHLQGSDRQDTNKRREFANAILGNN